MGCKLLAALFISGLVGSSWNQAHSAPLKKVGQGNDEVVSELEGLKHLLGSPLENLKEQISVSKSQTSFFVNKNGSKSGFSNMKNQVEKNGKLVAKLQQKINMIKDKNGKPKTMSVNEVEIPSEGIHNFIVKTDKNGKESEQIKEVSPPGSDVHGDAMNGLSGGVEYSPLDMAEYIYWTGDEKNVALMMEEFLEEGIMSRQEVINFLQSIKSNLDFMQARDRNLPTMAKKISSMAKKNDGDQNGFNNEKREEVEYYRKRNLNVYPENFLNKISYGDETDDEMLERYRMTDLMYKEYYLDEIIYQLAKAMFSRSFSKESTEVKALQKLITFLKTEVKNGQISKNLEKKLLDVLIAALIDSLSDYPEGIDAKDVLLNTTDINSSTAEARQQLPALQNGSSLDGLNMKRATEKIATDGDKIYSTSMKKLK